MNYVHTNGSNRDFVLLCQRVDSHLNAAVDGEENRAKYIEHNALDNIHDVIIAYDSDIPVGCASFKEIYPDTAEVKRVFVDPSYRNQGIAKQLMIEIEQRAADAGYTKTCLETGRVLKPAIAL